MVLEMGLEPRNIFPEYLENTILQALLNTQVDYTSGYKILIKN